MKPPGIDFGQLYRDRVRDVQRRERTPEYWDGRALNLRPDAFDSRYVRDFVARVDVSGCQTLLDVGCGPGTIGLSLAPRLAHVYGLDYSPGMLAVFADHARDRRLTNVTPILRAWEADWSDVPVCDVVVASRSTAVLDLEAALVKLASKARRRVYLTYPADGHLGEDHVRRAIGRPSHALPDYLCVAGILHDLGVYPRLDYLDGENRLLHCPTFADFQEKVSGLLGELTPDETARLRRYHDEQAGGVGPAPVRWALFWWEARGEHAGL
jgi:SAM-dependent methyltransferase